MSSQRHVRVLVVDNDPQTRGQVVKILEWAGYEVKVAEGQGVQLKESAKELAFTFKPHVVTMDLRLSDEHADDRSGLELWKDESFSSARCILYSAYLVQNRKITWEALQQTGVEDVIGKEDSPKSFLDAVERAARKACGASPAEDTHSGKVALIELFEKKGAFASPIIVERIVDDIDAIVRKIRFDGRQSADGGMAEVRKALQRTFAKYQLHENEVLFEQAYSYIREHY